MAGGVLRPVRRHVNMAKVRRVDRSRMAIGKCHVDAITMSVGNGNSVQSAVILIGRRGWSAGQRQFIAGNRYAITQPAGVGNALECCGIYGLPGRRGSICIVARLSHFAPDFRNFPDFFGPGCTPMRFCLGKPLWWRPTPFFLLT